MNGGEYGSCTRLCGFRVHTITLRSTPPPFYMVLERGKLEDKKRSGIYENHLGLIKNAAAFEIFIPRPFYRSHFLQSIPNHFNLFDQLSARIMSLMALPIFMQDSGNKKGAVTHRQESSFFFTQDRRYTGYCFNAPWPLPPWSSDFLMGCRGPPYIPVPKSEGRQR